MPDLSTDYYYDFVIDNSDNYVVDNAGAYVILSQTAVSAGTGEDAEQLVELNVLFKAAVGFPVLIKARFLIDVARIAIHSYRLLAKKAKRIYSSPFYFIAQKAKKFSTVLFFSCSKVYPIRQILAFYAKKQKQFANKVFIKANKRQKIEQSIHFYARRAKDIESADYNYKIRCGFNKVTQTIIDIINSVNNIDEE